MVKRRFEGGEIYNVGICADCGSEYPYGDNAKKTAIYCIACWFKHKKLQGVGA